MAQQKHFGDFYRNKKVLVTGHTGFKGVWLSQVLLSWGADVVGLALPPHTKPDLFHALRHQEKIKNYFVDIRDFERVKEVFSQEKPEIVFHLAAQALVRESYDDALTTFSTNVMGTANILHAVKETPSVRAAVIVTTDKVYENHEQKHFYRETDPLGGYDPYSASKAAADIVANSYVRSFFSPESGGNNVFVAIARSGNVVGGGDWANERLIPDIVCAVYEGNQIVTLRNPLSIRPWQHVLEPNWGYLKLAKGLYEGQKELIGPWNFGPEKSDIIDVETVTRKCLTLLGKGKCEIKPELSKYEAGILQLDIEKAKKILNWNPRFHIDEALELTMEWYKTYYESRKDIEALTDRQIELFFNE